MKNKVFYCTLLFVLFYNLVLRVPYEWLISPTGSDATVYSFSANSVVLLGKIFWFKDVKALFGMSPFSFPSGGVSFVSAISVITGLEIKYSILIMNLFLSSVSTVFAYFCGRTFFRDSKLSPMFVSMAYTHHHYFVMHTMWRFSIRGMQISFIPILFFFLIRTYQKEGARNKFWFLALLTLLICYTLHRIVVYMFAFIILPFLLLHIYNSWFKVSFRNRLNTRSVKYLNLIFLFLTLSIIVISAFNSSWYSSVGLPVEEEWLYVGYNAETFVGRLMNLSRTYASKAGLLFFVSIIGVFKLYLNNNRNIIESFLLMICVVQCIPIVDAEYFMPITIMTTSLLVGYGIKMVKEIDNYDIRTLLLVSLIIMPALFAYYQKDISTRIQVVRDWPENIKDNGGYGIQGEITNSEFWRVEHIPHEYMTIDEDNHWVFLAQHHNITTMEDLLFVSFSDRDMYDYTVDDDIGLLQILFHQSPQYFYGGKVNDWALGTSNIWGDRHTNTVLGKYDRWDEFVEYYEITYVFDFHMQPNLNNLKEDSYGEVSPFTKDVQVENYKVYENELYTFYFYKNWKY